MKFFLIVVIFFVVFIVSDWLADKVILSVKKRIAKKREKENDEFSTIPVEKLLEK